MDLGGLISLMGVPITLFYSIIETFFSLLTSDFIGGFLHFLTHLLDYTVLLFIIVELFFVMFSLLNSKDEYGKKSPFIIIKNYIAYHISLITLMSQSVMFIFSLIHKIVNTVIPM